jgi:hypothetical protein
MVTISSHPSNLTKLCCKKYHVNSEIQDIREIWLKKAHVFTHAWTVNYIGSVVVHYIGSVVVQFLRDPLDSYNECPSWYCTTVCTRKHNIFGKHNLGVFTVRFSLVLVKKSNQTRKWYFLRIWPGSNQKPVQTEPVWFSHVWFLALKTRKP